jgi:hypothetical protein
LKHTLFEACIVMSQFALALNGPDTWNREPRACCQREALIRRQYARSVRSIFKLAKRRNLCCVQDFATRSLPLEIRNMLEPFKIEAQGDD